MALIPIMNPIKDALDNLPIGENKSYHVHIRNDPRNYIGMSSVGHKCLRFLQYSFRKAFPKPSHSYRIERLFSQGHLLEESMRQDLVGIGAKVYDEQMELIGFAGHWKGHIDGRAKGLPSCEKTEHLWENKTHNDKNFKVLVKSQSVRESYPEHYDQMIAYMGYAKLIRGLYTAINKNNNEIYVERIYFDENRFEEVEFKMIEAVIADRLYPKIGTGKTTWGDCRYCPAKGVCHNNETIEMSCRTCRHVSIENEGKWRCEEPKSELFRKAHPLTNKELTPEQLDKGCAAYELEDMLK
ncbi:MAG: hypothetical protein V3R78_12485 [Thermodesulfobacteriota bacterium]